MTPRAPGAEGGGTCDLDCLTRDQARELVNIVTAARRMAHRTRADMLLSSDKVVDFCVVTKPAAEHVIAELRRMVEELDEVKERAVVALATPPTEFAARAGTAETPPP